MKNSSTRNRLIFLSTFMLLVVYGCGGFPGIEAKYGEPGCKQWSQRTAYRQVCASWRGDTCSYYKTEPYTEDYCISWKTKEEVEAERSLKRQSKHQGEMVKTKKTPPKKEQPARLIRKAKEADFPKNARAPTKGERYLLEKLNPFICGLLINDTEAFPKIMDFLNISMYSRKWSNEFNSQGFQGEISFIGYQKGYNRGMVHLEFKPTKLEDGKYWPFTENEFADWLSNSGLNVIYHETGWAIRTYAVDPSHKPHMANNKTAYRYSISLRRKYSDDANRFTSALWMTYDTTQSWVDLCVK